MTGFPLQFYAHLDTLRHSYEKTLTQDGLGADVTHINYNEASENLPDITLLDTETYALIRDHVSYVIRAIILGTINWREDVLKVSIPDAYASPIRRGPAGQAPPPSDQVRLRQGARPQAPGEGLDRLVEPGHAARLGLPVRLGSNDLDTVEPRARHQARVRSRPRCATAMRACSAWPQPNSKRRTRANSGSVPSSRTHSIEVGPDDRAEIAAHGTFAQKLVRICLRRLNAEIPIWQILHDKVPDIKLPESNAPTP